MCSRTTCSTCKKPTWSGCGNHIEQALAGVAKNDRCRCREGKSATAAKTSSAKTAATDSVARGGFLARLRGR